jgi:hypothetical protein
MVPTWALLELHITWLVKSSVAPDDVVPMAMNWLVWLGDATACAPGMIVSDVSVPPAAVVLVPVTVIAAVPAVMPGSVAEIVAVPGTNAVTSPVELTVATAGVLDVQVAWSVMSSVLEG